MPPQKPGRKNQGKKCGSLAKPGGPSRPATPVNRKELTKALPGPGEAPADADYPAAKKADWAKEREEAECHPAAEGQDLQRRCADCDEREEKLAALELDLAKQQETAKSDASDAAHEALTPARQDIDDERDRLAAQREDDPGKFVVLQDQEEDLKDERALFEQRVQREVERRSERVHLQAIEDRHTTLLRDHEELERLRKAEQRWDEDRAFLQAENVRLQQELTPHTINAVELHRPELAKDALDADKEAYEEAVQKLRNDFDGLT